MRVHVFIATTQGPVAIQRVVAEEPDVQSVICVDGGMQPLPISGRYHDFVRKGSGLIQRDFGQPAYRMDVSDRIDQGNSWQLPVYLAHYLSAEGLLGDGDPQPGDKVLWSTGALKADRSVLPVEEVFNKLTLSAELFESNHAARIPTLIVVPAEDASALTRWQQAKEPVPEGEQYAVAQLDEAVQHLDRFIKGAEPAREPGPEPDSESATAPSLLQEPYLPPPGMVSESVPALDLERETEFNGRTAGKRRTVWPWAALSVLLLAGAGVGGWTLVQSSLPPPTLVVEVAQSAGDCGQSRVIEQVLTPEAEVFPEVDLNRLCALWVEVAPAVNSVVGVSLDNGVLIPVNFNIDRWRVSLPSQRFRDREYALLLSRETVLDTALSGLSAELKRQRPETGNFSVVQLQELAQAQGIEAEVYTQKLTYRKMSSRDF